MKPWPRTASSRLRSISARATRTRIRPPCRFVANYRKAGGEIALEYIDAERHAGHSPDLSKTSDMFERMVVFVHRQLTQGPSSQAQPQSASSAKGHMLSSDTRA